MWIATKYCSSTLKADTPYVRNEKFSVHQVHGKKMQKMVILSKTYSYPVQDKQVICAQFMAGNHRFGINHLDCPPMPRLFLLLTALALTSSACSASSRDVQARIIGRSGTAEPVPSFARSNTAPKVCAGRGASGLAGLGCVPKQSIHGLT